MTNKLDTRIAGLYRQNGYTDSKVVRTGWIHGRRDCIEKMDTQMVRLYRNTQSRWLHGEIGLYRQNGYTEGQIKWIRGEQDCADKMDSWREGLYK